MFFNWISVSPATYRRRIIPATIIVKTNLCVVMLRGKTMRENVGHTTVFGNGVSVCIVAIPGREISVLIPISNNITVVVVCGIIENSVDNAGHKSAYATSSLRRIGKIKPPDVVDFQCRSCNTASDLVN